MPSPEDPAATSRADRQSQEGEPGATPVAPALPSILLASSGEAFDATVIAEAIALAREPRSYVHVLSIARIWGTALGLQHPGLYPTKREWQQQKDIVGDAVRKLNQAGLEAKGRVIGSRNASKVIAREAQRLGCRGIVIGARPLSWWREALLQNESRWLQWRSSVPVRQVPYEPHA